MTKRPRFNTAPAVIHPKEPLSAPLILWDSRNWNGSTGVGTGGLANEGSAGSIFNLDVMRSVGENGEIDHRGVQNSQSWVTPFGGDWDVLGGPPCDGPFTMILAVGTFQSLRPAGGLEATMLMRTVSPQLTHFGAAFSLFTTDDDRLTGQSEMFTGGNELSSLYPYNRYEPVENAAGFVPGGAGQYVRERLLVMTQDSVDGGGSYWRNGVAVTPRLDFIGPAQTYPGEQFDVDNTFQSCQYGPSSLASNNARFCIFGVDKRYDEIVPGEAWNGPIGYALFRGEPTPEDLAYWHDYFFNGYVPYVSPMSYSGGDWARVDDTYVYHGFNVNGRNLVPVTTGGPGLPATVDVFLVGGGGGGGNVGLSGNGSGGGGGGGEVKTVLGVTAPVVTTSPVVGAGGSVPVSPDFRVGRPGTASSYLGQTAAGGRGGGLGDGVVIPDSAPGGASGGGLAGGAPIATAGGGGGGMLTQGGDAVSNRIGGVGGIGELNNWMRYSFVFREGTGPPFPNLFQEVDASGNLVYGAAGGGGSNIDGQFDPGPPGYGGGLDGQGRLVPSGFNSDDNRGIGGSGDVRFVAGRGSYAGTAGRVIVRYLRQD